MNFGSKKVTSISSDTSSKFIEINAQMQGNVVFNDPIDLRINSKFHGELSTKGSLTIGETAQVEANIHGDSIIIAGRVKGNIEARSMLVLMPTANLEGDIKTPKLNIVEGAIFHGQCRMSAPDDRLTVEDVVQYLEIDQNTIIDLAKSGKIPALKDGDQWIFERAKIDHWALSGKVHS